jgi:tetratricopeptide (TPR) repeat protein
MVGLLGDARTDFLEAYGIADQSGWYDEASRSLLFLGTNAYLGDDLDSAEAYYRKALSMESQESSDNRQDRFLTETHFSLGTVLSDQGRLKEAAVEYEAALQISEKQHDVINIASALYNLGSLQLRQNDYFGAEKTLMRAIKVARQIDGSTNLKMHIYASLVRSSELRGDAKSACEHLYVAQKLYFDSAHHVDELEQLGTGLDCETIDL